MGQAKRRGTFEQRKENAVKEAEELRAKRARLRELMPAPTAEERRAQSILLNLVAMHAASKYSLS